MKMRNFDYACILFSKLNHLRVNIYTLLIVNKYNSAMNIYSMKVKVKEKSGALFQPIIYGADGQKYSQF